MMRTSFPFGGMTALLLSGCLAASGCHRREDSVIAGASAARGQVAIGTYGCGSCHTIAGVRGAYGAIGPPLTGVADRSMLAGVIANTPDNMMRWIRDPPAIDSATAMPKLGIDEITAADIVAYLYTLK